MNWIKSYVNYSRIFRAHSLEKLYQRNITFDELKEIENNLQVVEEYKDDKPFPSCLILGFTKSDRPIHLVFAINEIEKVVIIITVYQPDENKWVDNFKRRKQ